MSVVHFIITTGQDKNEKRSLNMDFVPPPIGTKTTFVKDPRTFYVKDIENNIIDRGAVSGGISHGEQHYTVHLAEVLEFPVKMSFKGGKPEFSLPESSTEDSEEIAKGVPVADQEPAAE